MPPPIQIPISVCVCQWSQQITPKSTGGQSALAGQLQNRPCAYASVCTCARVRTCVRERASALRLFARVLAVWGINYYRSCDRNVQISLSSIQWILIQQPVLPNRVLITTKIIRVFRCYTIAKNEERTAVLQNLRGDFRVPAIQFSLNSHNFSSPPFLPFPFRVTDDHSP
ncbi:hypothetical protein EG68_05019 [Paragonimus skrjabini miyazakii]|uniref:Uncharacterized protein n=1 Tax=Paragonimus skrjabini miyazakii TaxID=59628 RepID=A0A8S9YS22_9TREM|nr:hypothetical protein EG68_05019 [Paragonimus skrjabini miyazakii]